MKPAACVGPGVDVTRQLPEEEAKELQMSSRQGLSEVSVLRPKIYVCICIIYIYVYVYIYKRIIQPYVYIYMQC